MVEPSRNVPVLVGTGKILLEDQLAVTDDDHGVNVGFGFLQPRSDGAESRAIEVDAFGSGDGPAIVQCHWRSASRTGLSAAGRGHGEQKSESEAEAPQLFAALAHD